MLDYQMPSLGQTLLPFVPETLLPPFYEGIFVMLWTPLGITSLLKKMFVLVTVPAAH